MQPHVPDKARKLLRQMYRDRDDALRQGHHQAAAHLDQQIQAAIAYRDGAARRAQTAPLTRSNLGALALAVLMLAVLILPGCGRSFTFESPNGWRADYFNEGADTKFSEFRIERTTYRDDGVTPLHKDTVILANYDAQTAMVQVLGKAIDLLERLAPAAALAERPNYVERAPLARGGG